MASNFSVYICLYRYGDKAPKSSLARSFAVVWIIVGVTVCSVMTATLSNALTNVKIEKFDVTTGKRVIFFYWNINPLDHCRRWIGKRSSTFWWETLITPLLCFVWGYICFWFILAPSLPKASPNQIFVPVTRPPPRQTHNNASDNLLYGPKLVNLNSVTQWAQRFRLFSLSVKANQNEKQNSFQWSINPCGKQV